MSVTNQLIDSFRLKLHLRENAPTKGNIVNSSEVVTNSHTRLLGYIAFSVAEKEGSSSPVLWVDDIAVHSSERRKRIGVMLFKQLAENRRAQTYNEIHLLVRRDAEQQEQARKLYKSLGFVENTDKSKQYYEPNDDSQTYMVATLKTVREKAQTLLDQRSDKNEIDIRFARDTDWMKQNAKNSWKNLQKLYTSVHNVAEGDGADIHKVLVDDVMFLLAVASQ
jgi:L-amino acid N-acyltransferase YncA